MNLFVIYIGGTHSQALIELHDLRIIAADTIEDTYDILRKTWWGTPESLHLDAWGILKHVDGYDIRISKARPDASQDQLFFLNLGGYDSEQFTELHQNVFVVAKDISEAKIKAKKNISHWETPHKDYQYEIENIMHVSPLLDENMNIHLIASRNAIPFEFVCKYVAI